MNQSPPNPRPSIFDIDSSDITPEHPAELGVFSDEAKAEAKAAIVDAAAQTRHAITKTTLATRDRVSSVLASGQQRVKYGVTKVRLHRPASKTVAIVGASLALLAVIFSAYYFMPGATTADESVSVEMEQGAGVTTLVSDVPVEVAAPSLPAVTLIETDEPTKPTRSISSTTSVNKDAPSSLIEKNGTPAIQLFAEERKATREEPRSSPLFPDVRPSASRPSAEKVVARSKPKVTKVAIPQAKVVSAATLPEATTQQKESLEIPAPSATCSVGGSVTDAKGSPIGNAKIFIVSSSDPRQTIKLLTDVSGRFLLDEIARGSLRVSIRAKGFREEVREGTRCGSLPTVVLEKGNPITALMDAARRADRKMSDVIGRQ